MVFRLYRSATMARLYVALSCPMGRKVIDRTGIPGMFDIRLDFSGGESPTVPAPPPLSSSSALPPGKTGPE